MPLTNYEQELIRVRPQSTELNLSIFQPGTVFACQVNEVTGTVVARGDRVIPYDTVSAGSYLNVESGMTMLVGTTLGDRDLGRIRVKSITTGSVTVSENSHIPWDDNLYLTVQRYWEVWPIYPRIINDPGNDEDVIFYKDYDIPYTNQNTVLGAFPCAGNHRAMWVGEQTYWSSTGTSHLLGSALTYNWAFEGGTSITGSTASTPGYVTYNTPGHFVTRLIVTGANGSVDTTYRYVSVYNKPKNSSSNNPVKKFQVQGVSGSKGEGGHRSSIRVVDESITVHDGDVAVLFADDWYGSVNQSIGGNSLNNSKIFFVGHVIGNTIRYDYQSSSVEFELGTFSEMLKATETYAISLESRTPATKWFDMPDLNGKRGIYHYLKWHSTALFLADFEFKGIDPPVQYFDTDRQSLFDAIDNYMRNALVGTLASDRQGKMWIETGKELAVPYPTAAYPTEMYITRRDWIGEPSIEERMYNEVSFIEVGGVYYHGDALGTYQAFLSQAPGFTPDGKGRPENIPGLALLTGQDHLNQIAGHIYANRNAQYPSIQFDASSGFRNLDIAPTVAVSMIVDATDTNSGIVLDASTSYLVDGMDWTYDVKNQLLLPNISLVSIVNGQIGETVEIPEIPPDGGDTSGGGNGGIDFPPFPTGTFGTTRPTYTWSLKYPGVGGIPGPYMSAPHIASQVNAYCVGGTSVVFNIEVRPTVDGSGTAGGDILAADATATTVSGQAFPSAPYLTLGSWLWLDISAINGAVTDFVVTLTTSG